MRCTGCSTHVKPVAVFDLDGTLADYHNSLATFCGRYWGLSPRNVSAACHWDGEGNFEDALGINREQYRQAKLAFRQGGMKRIMPTFNDGGLHLIRNLHDEDVEIWYATQRPWQSLSNIDPDTRWWIESHHLPIDGILYDEDKYVKLVTNHVERERIILVVDDLPEMYDSAYGLGLPVKQVARPHNSGTSQKRQWRLDMAGVRDQARRNLEEWRMIHG